MQFAHFGSEPEKLPPPHPALPYDVTAGALHSAESAPSHGIAPRSFQAPHLHHPTAPHPCLFATLHLCRSMAPCAYRPTAPYLCHAMLPSPTPLTVPRQVRSPPGTAPELPEVWKQKVIKIATFLRLAIAADVQITDRAPKMKQNDRPVPHFHFTGDEKEPLIAKSCKSARIFVFVRRITATGADSVMSQSPNGSRSRDELIAATRRTPMNDART